ncbi:hypothetical protein NDU88_003180 [Pleurodeles waltl]|uniref:Uncharacterized protein n=1 Tax=Pleurodeles waltl TaxID=8319 RepID=A0AAV7KWS2_PLEWA|nr:hypothetical protein NDU88_003180 [Pleurodeles waltl]
MSLPRSKGIVGKVICMVKTRGQRPLETRVAPERILARKQKKYPTGFTHGKYLQSLLFGILLFYNLVVLLLLLPKVSVLWKREWLPKEYRQENRRNTPRTAQVQKLILTMKSGCPSDPWTPKIAQLVSDTISDHRKPIPNEIISKGYITRE